MKEFVQNVITNTGAGVLFPKAPTLLFDPESDICPRCGSMLQVRKTVMKRVVTMGIGAFRVKETIFFCPHDQENFSSGQLRSLVPRGGTFGFDVMVEVGIALFVHCRNNREIMTALGKKNVFISEREVSYLGRKFIVYLALAHQEGRHKLRDLMRRKGGYILHVDGTCEGDSPNLFCGLDEISALVLDTIKIPSEKKEQLIPFFQRIKEQYDEPKALVHDMGRGILTAVKAVFPGVPDFICHFHFLRDLGKDLLLDNYTALQKRLQNLEVRSVLRQRAKYLESKINLTRQDLDQVSASFESGAWKTSCFEHVPLIAAYALIHWVFDYRRQSNGYGFPFDRPHLDFFRRLQNMHRLIGQIRTVQLRGQIKDNKPFFQIYSAVEKIVDDKQLNDLAKILERDAAVFDKLRSAMRIALPETKSGINDNGDGADIKSIEEKVTAFRKWLVTDSQRQENYSKMLGQIDKYWDKLFSDPLPVSTPEGVVYIQPQRTNNILERFFREEKRHYRKKSGTASMSKVLKSLLADTPLVQNLKNSEYMDLILNGCSSLAERFSKIDAHLVKEKMSQENNNREKILPEIKKLVKNPNLTIKISSLFLPIAK